MLFIFFALQNHFLIMARNDNMIITFNKTSIEIDEFNEDLNIQNIYRNESGENRIDFDEIHMNSFRYNNIIQKEDNLNMKFIFKRFEIKSYDLKLLEN